ncbi:MAG: DegT/DnrJ/EryC1/StrS family aminotransferase, partial [Candidatus Omnitrophica bacterium]|nr:DegT/DnrJ/EryC1/StrS family aminotransferase [Candidatus Omnitrophota bacterium]
MGGLAIDGGRPVRDVSQKPWPAWPIFGEPEKSNLLEVFESGHWFYGKKVKEFEEKFATFQGANFGVSCTNGTAALEMALYACGIKAGDEVIIPPYSFIATASAVLRMNGVPIFADINLETCNLDPEDTERKITERTRAIIPVHVGGLPADMDAFKLIAQKYRLKLIEDACHSWGSQWKGKGTGALGDCGAFSFQMSKNITSGEGGILLTEQEEIADIARSFSNCGRSKTGQWYQHVLAGTNLRLTELQAAILLGQLSRLKEQTEHREKTARILDEALKNVPGIETIPSDERVTRRSYHLYIFRFIGEDWKI